MKVIDARGQFIGRRAARAFFATGRPVDFYRIVVEEFLKSVEPVTTEVPPRLVLTWARKPGKSTAWRIWFEMQVAYAKQHRAMKRAAKRKKQARQRTGRRR